MGTMAPASSAAPWRAGRHRAAARTTATSATITATSPAITGAGFANALPAVRDRVTPAAVRSTQLSHEGANATAAPSAARISTTTGPVSLVLGRRAPPAGRGPKAIAD